MSVGIEATKSAVHSVFGIVKSGISLAKSFSKITAEIGDIDAGEIVALITQVCVEEIPALVDEAKR